MTTSRLFGSQMANTSSAPKPVSRSLWVMPRPPTSPPPDDGVREPFQSFLVGVHPRAQVYDELKLPALPGKELLKHLFLPFQLILLVEAGNRGIGAIVRRFALSAASNHSGRAASPSHNADDPPAVCSATIDTPNALVTAPMPTNLSILLIID